MGKIKISKKRQRSLEKSQKNSVDKIKGLKRINPLKELVNPQQTALAILECLQNNDPEGAMEMISIYLDALNKARLRKNTKLAKSTMYSALKHRNPTIKTLAKIMHSSTH
ncbi:MAG: hypothetical protein V4492_07870 [Chlamydiota bacterium]